MPENQNPVSFDVKPDAPVEYQVPASFANAMLYITVKIQLAEKSWQYAAFHTVSFRGKDIYPNKIPEPSRLKIDAGKVVDGKKLSLTSHVSCFRDGGDTDKPPVVKYSLRIEAGDTLLDEFTSESDTRNPSNFYTFIQFKLMS